MGSFGLISAQTTTGPRNCCTESATTKDGTFTINITRCSSGEQTTGDAEEHAANCIQAESDLIQAITILNDDPDNLGN